VDWQKWHEGLAVVIKQHIVPRREGEGFSPWLMLSPKME
jgi:hypothetical protein